MLTLFVDQRKSSFHQSVTEEILSTLAGVHELAGSGSLTIPPCAPAPQTVKRPNSYSANNWN